MKDGLDDRVFDSLMEEMLTNQHPPDLTDVIQQRLREELGPELWQQLRNGRMRYLGPPHDATNASPVTPVLGQSISSQSTPGQFTPPKATPVSATPIVAPPVPSVSASPVIATAVRPGASADSSVSLVDASRLRSTGGRVLSVAMATLAAGTLIALSIWSLWPESDSAQSSVAQGTNAPVPSVAVEPTLADSPNTGNGSPTNGSTNKLERDQLATGTGEGSSRVPDAPSLAQTKKGEELSLENLPFNAQPKQLEVTQDVPKPTRVAVRLSDSAVAAAVDAQFEKLWQSQQLDVKPAVAREEVLVRMSAVLVDQPSSETNDPTAAVAEKLVRTATFAEHWADRIAEYWL
ncbi:MAG: hypothetical protein IT423_17905, partial [Pirellulaceae bacterium]|nr:hypothetical protein [Pirellulaceae bacterium]